MVFSVLRFNVIFSIEIEDLALFFRYDPREVLTSNITWLNRFGKYPMGYNVLGLKVCLVIFFLHDRIVRHTCL
jgi:hypothetical protein